MYIYKFINLVFIVLLTGLGEMKLLVQPVSDNGQILVNFSIWSRASISDRFQLSIRKRDNHFELQVILNSPKNFWHVVRSAKRMKCVNDSPMYNDFIIIMTCLSFSVRMRVTIFQNDVLIKMHQICILFFISRRFLASIDQRVLMSLRVCFMFT